MARKKHRLRRLAERVGLLAASMTVALLLAEGVVRLLAPQQLILLRPDVWLSDDVLGWRRAPGLDTRINTGERTVRLLTDEWGHRVSAAGPARDPEVRVLALGDSFIEALQVEQEESMTGLLESGLRERLATTVSVVSSGVAGYGPNHYLLQAREELGRARYDAVVVFLFLGNDVMKERLDRIPPKTPETRHALRFPRGFQAKELIDSLLYPLNDFLEVRSQLFMLLRTRVPAVKARLVAIRHAAKKKTADPEAVFLDSVVNPALRDSPRWALTAGICAEISVLVEQQGARPLFVLLPQQSWIDPRARETEATGMGIDPSRMDVEQPFRRMIEELARRRLPVVDTWAAFQESWQAGEKRLFGRVDTHLAPAGHRLVAELVLPRLLERLAEPAAAAAQAPPRTP